MGLDTRASLEELLCDYEDYLRQNHLSIWDIKNALRQMVIDRRFQTADEVAAWVREIHQQQGLPIAELVVNAIHALITVNCILLKRQINSQAKAFEEEGGFTERLYHTRKKSRDY